MNEPVAIITGSGRGIGAASARRLAEGGFRVVITSRTQTEIDEVLTSLPKDRSFGIAGDIANEEFIHSLFQKTQARFGQVNALVNNAATVETGDFSTLSVEVWDHIMAVNLRAVFLCCREAFQVFKKQGQGGSIVNLSSLGGLPGTSKFKGLTAYSTSKFGVTGLTECLAEEGREFSIRVNCVAPGAVDTAMLRKAAPFLKTKTTPEDVAKTIHFLCDSSQSGAITGSAIAIHSNL